MLPVMWRHTKEKETFKIQGCLCKRQYSMSGLIWSRFPKWGLRGKAVRQLITTYNLVLIWIPLDWYKQQNIDHISFKTGLTRHYSNSLFLKIFYTHTWKAKRKKYDLRHEQLLLGRPQALIFSQGTARAKKSVFIFSSTVPVIPFAQGTEVVLQHTCASVRHLYQSQRMLTQAILLSLKSI